MNTLHSTIIDIFEARERLGWLPMTDDEIAELAEACAEFAEDNEAYMKAEGLVTSEYGQGVWDSLKGWLEHAYFNGSTEQIIQTLKATPLDRLARMIGAGSFGAVLDYDRDKVIKWFHSRDGIDADDMKFYNECKKEGGKGSPLPQIYRIGRNYVVMEKLLTMTPKCKMYARIFDDRKYDVSSGRWWMSNIINHKYADDLYRRYDHMSKEEADRDFEDLHGIASSDRKVAEVLEWYMKMHDILAGIGIGFPSDIRLMNIGERPSTHEIVAFDI